MKKIWISLLVLVGLFVLYVGYTIWDLNQVEKVTERTGKYFDESGKQLGVCKERTALRKSDSGPGRAATYYYDLDESKAGSCKGTFGGCTTAGNDTMPSICRPKTLQTECNKAIYTVGVGATLKYECVLD